MTSSSTRSAASSNAPEAGAADIGPVEPTPVGALVVLAQRGDREAFRELYRRFAPAVNATLLCHAPAPEVEDLLQDVFLTAWRDLGRLREADHVGAWMCGIARNLARRWHRRRRSGPGAATSLAQEPVDPRPAGPAQAARVSEVLAAIRRLPRAYRETLMLRLVEGLSGPQIAALTGLTPGSVRVNLSRGMQRLRELLRREGWS